MVHHYTSLYYNCIFNTVWKSNPLPSLPSLNKDLAELENEHSNKEDQSQAASV